MASSAEDHDSAIVCKVGIIVGKCPKLLMYKWSLVLYLRSKSDSETFRLMLCYPQALVEFWSHVIQKEERGRLRHYMDVHEGNKNACPQFWELG